MLAASIEDHAVIGDGRAAALVTSGGVLDWLCWPRFDSPAVFGALLDPVRGGAWVVAPAGDARVSRKYERDTNVLVTRFEMASGTLVLRDLLLALGEGERRAALCPEAEILREASCERGEVLLEVAFDPRPDFGRARAQLEHVGALGWRVHLPGSGVAWLRSEVPLAPASRGLAGRATMRGGESRILSLTRDADAPAILPPLGTMARERADRTAAFWRTWAGRVRYAGPYRDAIVRSALTMKLLSFAPSGALVAAATTSLPERPGGDLNWDYRFCWLRDAAFTARAFLSLGYHDEARAFCDWLLHSTRLTAPELRVLYDVYGRVPGPEREIEGLAGYGGARPIRVGNAARAQFQLDGHGELVDAVCQYARVTGALDRDTQRLLRGIGDWVSARWMLPDHGIWEQRGLPRHHTHSRVLCWVALDRLLDLCRRGFLPRGRAHRWSAARDSIRRDVEAHGFHRGLGAYTRELGGDTVDASTLLLSWYGFRAVGSRRMRGTWHRVRERLEAGPGLLYRNEDSRGTREGAFGICAFWAADHLARGGGTLAEAQAMFEAACARANDLGLFAEEVDPATGGALGNFPQAYTHVGLVNAALTLEDRARSEGGWRAA